ncbi:MAG: uracil-DNA glycosylase [Gammaproteobacteria bacterium]|nr:uracil-DNA glycosylase [Gammaproteobacteria bacterium]
MSKRAAILDRLGIQQWVLRGHEPAAVEAPAAPGDAAAPAPTRPVSTAANEMKALLEYEQPQVSAPTTEPHPDVARQGVEVQASDWSELRAEVAGCTACELHKTRTQTVFGVGNEQADWMIIGEAPGAEEDKRGEPFVGTAGQLLDLILESIDQPRSKSFIANILKCRPPSNRDPHQDEAAACSGFLDKQIEWVQPKVILCVGRVSAQTLLSSSESTARLRGKVHRHPATGIPVVVTYHPAYLLRRPIEKRKVWEDLKLARRVAAGEVTA